MMLIGLHCCRKKLSNKQKLDSLKGFACFSESAQHYRAEERTINKELRRAFRNSSLDAKLIRMLVVGKVLLRNLVECLKVLLETRQ